MPGLENVVADALIRQYDDEDVSAVVHSIAHTLSDIDLTELAQEQLQNEDELATSLKLSPVSFPGVERPVVCDTSLERPRVLVPSNSRRQVFDAIHNLAHPSGQASLSMIARHGGECGRTYSGGPGVVALTSRAR